VVAEQSQALDTKSFTVEELTIELRKEKETKDNIQALMYALYKTLLGTAARDLKNWKKDIEDAFRSVVKENSQLKGANDTLVKRQNSPIRKVALLECQLKEEKEKSVKLRDGNIIAIQQLEKHLSELQAANNKLLMQLREDGNVIKQLQKQLANASYRVEEIEKVRDREAILLDKGLKENVKLHNEVENTKKSLYDMENKYFKQLGATGKHSVSPRRGRNNNNHFHLKTEIEEDIKRLSSSFKETSKTRKSYDGYQGCGSPTGNRFDRPSTSMSNQADMNDMKNVIESFRKTIDEKDQLIDDMRIIHQKELIDLEQEVQALRVYKDSMINQQKQLTDKYLDNRVSKLHEQKEMLKKELARLSQQNQAKEQNKHGDLLATVERLGQNANGGMANREYGSIRKDDKSYQSFSGSDQKKVQVEPI
jgi:DNA repair exonuclease SbcCD ATPase subunit